MENITANLVRKLLPPRDPRGHKGTFGKVYVLGGAVGYTGAPVYAGEGAVRCGSGLVFVGVPEAVYPIVAARCEVSMAHPISGEYDAILGRIAGCDVAVLGPGLGRSEKTDELVCRLLADLDLPIVLDADGINAVSAHIDVLADRRSPTVVTPHEGEFLRLGGDLSQGREKAAKVFAERHGCILVLKGPETLIAAPNGRVMRNTTGNCGMAKGGSGDVLAGMIASLVGQGAEPYEAAVSAVWLHGRAGDLCAADLTEYAMTPVDMIRRLPAVFKELTD